MQNQVHRDTSRHHKTPFSNLLRRKLDPGPAENLALSLKEQKKKIANFGRALLKVELNMKEGEDSTW